MKQPVWDTLEKGNKVDSTIVLVRIGELNRNRGTKSKPDRTAGSPVQTKLKLALAGLVQEPTNPVLKLEIFLFGPCSNGTLGLGPVTEPVSPSSSYRGTRNCWF